MFLGEIVVPEAPARHRARPVGLDEDVRASEQLVQGPAGGLGLEVERDGALALVQIEVKRACLDNFFAFRKRAPAADRVPAGPFDLDHVRAKPREQAGAPRAGDVATEVDHTDACERALHRSSSELAHTIADGRVGDSVGALIC